MMRVLFILAVAAAIWAWYSRKQEPSTEEVHGIITDQQIEYMQRARDTEEVLFESVDQQRQQIDEQAR